MEADYTELFNRLINNYSPVNPAGIKVMLETGSIQAYSKNEIIFSEKKFNAFEYFQLEGISHRFNTDADNQPITTGLFEGSKVITPHFARTRNSQSIFSLQALTDSSFLKIPIGTFDQLRFSNEQIRALGQRVVEKEFMLSLHYEVLFRSYAAKDRLLYFRSIYPLLENLIPHNVIASFLGITAVSFSRLRNELTKLK